MEECFGDAEDFFYTEEGPGPRNYVRPEPIHVRNIALVVEAIQLPTGKMSMKFHHFDARELPIVALNRKRIFFLAKSLIVDDRNCLSTDLDLILDPSNR